MLYRMRKDSEDRKWHFSTNCPAWPESDYEESHEPALNSETRLCPECAKLELTRLDIFESPDWFYELKYDGFRALAYLENRACSFISRKGNRMKRFDELC